MNLSELTPIRVVAYDPEWPRRFQSECIVLKQVLGPWLDGGIHHVGSTAIPGLAAKPIIDMIAGVRDLEEARAAFEPLRQFSYIHAPHRPGIAHHFAKSARSHEEVMHGIHLTEPGSDLWKERLVFRDALRGDPQLLAEYQELKVTLAREHADDIGAYTAAKGPFVARVLARSGLKPVLR